MWPGVHKRRLRPPKPREPCRGVPQWTLSLYSNKVARLLGLLCGHWLFIVCVAFPLTWGLVQGPSTPWVPHTAGGAGAAPHPVFRWPPPFGAGQHRGIDWVPKTVQGTDKRWTSEVCEESPGKDHGKYCCWVQWFQTESTKQNSESFSHLEFNNEQSNRSSCFKFFCNFHQCFIEKWTAMPLHYSLAFGYTTHYLIAK